MRIALLTDGIWPFVIGGMQKHSYYLCKYLARRKVYVHLYHTLKRAGEVDLERCFTKEELPYIQSHLITWPPADKFPGHYTRTSFAYSKRVYERFIKDQPQQPVELVYAKGLAGWYMLTKKTAATSIPPVYLNVHGYEYYQKSASVKSYLEQLMLRPSFRYVNEKADYIYSYGGNITGIIRQHIKNSKDRIIEIPTGIEEGFISSEPVTVSNPRQFVYLGRYERRKGIHELTKSIREIVHAYDFHFHFIGEIPEAAKLESPKVTYHGLLNDRDSIKSILQKVDVLVCPSYAEGMPNVILEGMACGCAIIASDVGAVPAQVDEENGWLIAPGSMPLLKEALIQALTISETELNSKRRSSIRRIKEKFLWSKIITKVIDSFTLSSKHSAV